MGVPVIVSACRTAIGRMLGGLSSLRAPEFGAVTIREAVKRAEIDPAAVEEVIMGNVVSAGLGQNPARQAAIKGGIPVEAGAITINKVCGSGMKAIVLAAQAITCNDIEVTVVGGMESMSNVPYILRNARTGYRLGHGEIIDTMIYDGLWDVHNDIHMGETGELVADKYKISRKEQDEYSVASHMKAHEATVAGKFKAEIVPVAIPQRKGDPIMFSTDEGIRSDTTVEALGKLRPAFKKDGTVTAGNASQISDGASALVVMDDKRAAKEGVKPVARILAYAINGVAPEWVMLAPLGAVQKILKKLNVAIDYFDLFEINEPFAVATMALQRDLEIPADRLNVNGGAVALGHPIGCTGARLVTTLIYALKNAGKKRGLAGLCLGGGNAVAIAIELV
ncbi:MAG: acetyl-CoA C-acetyltransferase [Planctomycetota bacterium]